MTKTLQELVAAMPDEVVTHARVRTVHLAGVEKPLALITLDNDHDHTRPSTFGPGGLASLDAALDHIATLDVCAIGVTGKPFILAVGADLDGVGGLSERDDVLAVAREGHRVFRRLHDATVPTFGFINGAAMGGGLEIALHCHFRTVARGAAPIALPEVFLGLIPGWGGTQLLPQLIGIEKAIDVVLDNALSQNRTLRGTQAHALGIADVLLDDADFLEQSLLWASAVVRGEITVERTVDTEAWDAGIARARALVAAKTSDASPAAVRAVELLDQARSGDLTAGFAAEDEALADLVLDDALRAGLYSFDLTQKRAKRPAGAPDRSLARKVTKVGVVGAGLMASQLALLFATKLEVPVVMTDLDQERLDKGVAYVHDEVDKLAGKKRISPDRANRLKALVSGSLTKDVFDDADLVIEAVFEELGIKKKVFAELEEHISAECLLLTNTSSLSVTEMAADLAHPERVVGFHFFSRRASTG